MKALTVAQPYAELIRRGVKPIENRNWPTTVRGRVAIHSGKSTAWLDPGDLVEYPGMAFGAIVCTAELYDCVKIEALPEPLVGHAHAYGPWCFLLRDVHALVTPVATRGYQMFWEWEPPEGCRV